MGLANHLLGVAFAGYIAHVCHTFYTMAKIPLLEEGPEGALYAVKSSIPESILLDMDVYVSNRPGVRGRESIPWTAMARVATFENVTYDWRGNDGKDGSEEVKLSGDWIPDRFRSKNESLFAHVVLRKAGVKGHRKASNLLDHRVMDLSSFMIPQEERDGRHYLLDALVNRTYAEEVENSPAPVPRLSVPKKMEVGLIVETRPMDVRKLYQKGLGGFVDQKTRKLYLPIFMNTHATPRDEFEPVPAAGSPDALPEMTISFHKVGMSYWMLSESLLQGFEHMEDVMKVNEYDLDSFKMLLSGSSGPWRLLVVYGVSFLHILFEYLSLRSDFKFFKERTSFEGLSRGSIAMNMVMSLISCLYVLEQDESRIVLYFLVIRIVFSGWKLMKMSKSKDASLAELEEMQGITNDEVRCMKYLGLLLLPVVVAFCTYRLVNYKFRSWYSFLILSLAACSEVFGFVVMTPQVFLNYRLKSVEHLPWRALSYQACNTFIDDVFTLVIRMPEIHKFSVFRDDIVFIICCYQRWIYSGRRHQEEEEAKAAAPPPATDPARKKAE
ncbi:hypothetical protein FOZ62_013171 [Perkinsus olseni]|uniref:Cleft lip and palate transmembrane protein 1 n=2 Tax=Perkinsus olseni TaxID=32597 RepID=A0A7J6UFT2_PEROL|nr:hypothetical protein FOZ62_013171 [Perkinsus olseni]